MKDKKGKSQVKAPVQCQYKGCHSKPSKHSFCPEHFEQFKFGLINKKGKMVPDHAKKMEHFMRLKNKSRAA